MTEIIDSFRTGRTAGRGKAITLFVLTTVGSCIKLFVGGFFIYLLNALNSAFGGSRSSEASWTILTLLLVILFGFFLFAGSLMMLKRIKAGLWIYIVAQILTVALITYTVLALNRRMDEGVVITLGITYVVAGVFTSLYLSNAVYYSRKKQPDDSLFMDNNTAESL